MEREGVSLEEGEDGDQAPNTVLTVGENKSATWILDQEVVQVQILQWRKKKAMRLPWNEKCLLKQEVHVPLWSPKQQISSIE